MPEIKQQEDALLNEIAQDPLVTQANLSNRLDMAVGSVNWHIKRLITRGWVKVAHLDRTRFKYDLTPEGMVVFTQRALLYAGDSLKVYRNFRQQARTLVLELGQGEVADVLRLTSSKPGYISATVRMALS